MTKDMFDGRTDPSSFAKAQAKQGEAREAGLGNGGVDDWPKLCSILAQTIISAWAECPALFPAPLWRPFAWMTQTWWRLAPPLESRAKSWVPQLQLACSVRAVGLGNTCLPEDPQCSPMQVRTCRNSRRSSPGQKGNRARREPRTASQPDAVTSSATLASPRSQGRHDA